MKRYIKGFTFCILWYLSVLAGFFVLICPILPLAIISPKNYRKWSDRIFGMWEPFPVALMEICLGVRVVLTGDKINPSEGSLFIMNHRTRVDWNFFFLGLFHCCHPVVAHNIKIILKAPLRHFPGAGWVMQTCSFIFLHRNWEKDKPLLKKILEYLDSSDKLYQILLFPEGTDLNENNLKKSHKYSEEHNLEKYCNVLHPRTTGFVFLVTKMRSDGQLQAVYDVTVAYPKTMPRTELDLLRGKFPEEVHFHVKRHASSSLPEDEKGLETWLKKVWKEKEKKLEKFCKTKSFSSEDGDEGFVYSLSDQDIDFGKMTIKNGVISYENDEEKVEDIFCSDIPSLQNIDEEAAVTSAAIDKSQATVVGSVGMVSTPKDKSQATVIGSVGAVSAAKEKLQSLRESIEAELDAKEKSEAAVESVGAVSMAKEKLQSIRESIEADFRSKEKSQSAADPSKTTEKSQATIIGSVGGFSAAKEKFQSLKETFGGDSKSKVKSQSVVEAATTGSATAHSAGIKSISLKETAAIPTDDRFENYRPCQLLYLVLVFWLTLITVMFYMLTYSSYLQIWIFTHVFLFTLLSVVSNGFHLVAASYYLYRYRAQPCSNRKSD